MVREYYYQFCTRDSMPLDLQTAKPATSLRKNKPITGWLTQDQNSLTKAKARVLWRKSGIPSYISSGLLGWQCRAVKGKDVIVFQYELKSKPQFADSHQIVTQADNVRLVRSIPLGEFFERFGACRTDEQTDQYISLNRRELAEQLYGNSNHL